MAGKPVDQVAAARWPKGRAAIWAAIRGLARAGEFTRPDIARVCQLEVHKSTIQSYVRGLIAAGIIGLVDRPSPGKGACRYRLLRDPGSEAPRVTRAGAPVTQGLATENIWRTLKRAGPVTIAELALLASTDDVLVAPVAVKSYIAYLKHAGYVRIVRAANPRGGKEVVIFLPARDPGPLPPQIQRTHRVWDPNSKTVVWPKDGVGNG